MSEGGGRGCLVKGSYYTREGRYMGGGRGNVTHWCSLTVPQSNTPSMALIDSLQVAIRACKQTNKHFNRMLRWTSCFPPPTTNQGSLTMSFSVRERLFLTTSGPFESGGATAGGVGSGAEGGAVGVSPAGVVVTAGTGGDNSVGGAGGVA